MADRSEQRRRHSLLCVQDSRQLRRRLDPLELNLSRSRSRSRCDDEWAGTLGVSALHVSRPPPDKSRGLRPQTRARLICRQGLISRPSAGAFGVAVEAAGSQQPHLVGLEPTRICCRAAQDGVEARKSGHRRGWTARPDLHDRGPHCGTTTAAAPTTKAGRDAPPSKNDRAASDFPLDWPSYMGSTRPNSAQTAVVDSKYGLPTERLVSSAAAAAGRCICLWLASN